MKKGFYIISATVAIALLAACSGAAETESEEEQVSENCIYSYDSTSTVFEWTGYKTTAKVAVKGSFNEMEITGPSLSSDDPIAMLKQLSFKMKTASVETANEVRNGKIANFFFGAMEDTEYLTGKVKSLSEDGSAVVSVRMNGVTMDVKGTYSFENNKFSFDATIDVMNWNAGGALESISEVCSEQHTGDDGELVTWSEVALSFSTLLKSDCD